MKAFYTILLTLCARAFGVEPQPMDFGRSPQPMDPGRSPQPMDPGRSSPVVSSPVSLAPEPVPQAPPVEPPPVIPPEVEMPPPPEPTPGKDRTITTIVKLLREMLDKSKTDGESERELYAKYKCYCDTNEKEKDETIKDKETQIQLQEAKIQKLKAENGVLSEETAQLKKDIAENEDAQAKAIKIRGDENKAFLAEEADLLAANSSVTDAIAELSKVGADQDESVGADHTQFMADHNASFSQLKQATQAALLAARSFVSSKQTNELEAFIQVPFTGTYTSQSAEVLGILKEMRDTFVANLKSSRAAEKAAVEAHTKLMKALTDEHKKMEDSYKEKQGKLGANDGSLSSEKSKLATTRKELGAAQQFLSELLDMCKKKSAQYQERLLLRANEEAAIAEAISILDSDAAFATFSTVAATTSGSTSFLQRQQVIHRHLDDTKVAQQFLRKAAKESKSLMLSRAAALLEAHNPFTIVLEEISKMMALIKREGEQDEKEHQWCIKERKENNDNLDQKKKDITTLKGAISDLDTEINDPVDGLLALIAGDEKSLEENIHSQKELTTERTTENLIYQQNIANLVDAEHILKKAISVLKRYYDKILKEEAGLLQQSPAPPATWDDDYKGQSGKGKNAVTMLEFVLENTKKEESAAHTDENDDQIQYEKTMQGLRENEESLLGSIASNQKILATKQKELLAKEEDLKVTEKEKAAIEAYLLKIKPGCDFLDDEIDKRKANRKTEKDELEKAVTLIKGTPHYKTAIAQKHNETLGDCLSTCAGRQDHVECKACLEDVSIPGYCAGHPGTEGC